MREKNTVFCILFSWEVEVPSQMLIKKLNLEGIPKKDEVTYFLKGMVYLYEKNLMIGRFSCLKESFLAEKYWLTFISLCLVLIAHWLLQLFDSINPYLDLIFANINYSLLCHISMKLIYV